MNQKEDKRLRKLFEEVRRKVQDSTPSFRQTWRAAQSRRLPERSGSGFLRFAAVSVLVLAVGISLYMVGRVFFQAVIVPYQERSLSQWKAPTDFLLRTPGMEILQSVPTFSSPDQAFKQINQGVQQ